MALKIGKREKLSAGIVIMILTIGAVHLFGFHVTQSPRKEKENLLTDLYNKRPGIPAPDKTKFSIEFLNEYDAKTGEYLAEAIQIEEKYGLLMPEEYLGKYGEPAQLGDEVTTGYTIRRQAMFDLVKQLMEFRDNNQTADFKVAFLGPEGWDFPENSSVPQDANIVLDRLSEIQDRFGLLKGINLVTSLELAANIRQQMYLAMDAVGIKAESLLNVRNRQVDKELKFDEQEAALLQQNQLNPNPTNLQEDAKNIQRNGVNNFVATMKLIAHLQLVEERVGPQDKEIFDFDIFLDNIIASSATDIKMAMPRRLFMHASNEQVKMLLKLLQTAKDHDIADVKEVYLYQTFPITVAEGYIKKHNPIRIVVTGEHRRVTDFLWVITHSQLLIELDNLKLSGDSEGNLTADALINFLSFSSIYSEIYENKPPVAPPPVTTPDPGGGGGGGE